MSERTTRGLEIQQLLSLTPEEVQQQAGARLVVCADINVLHEHMAQNIADEIRSRNNHDLPTRLILPVGPTGQYPILAEIINQQKLSLKNCWLFFMDEYADAAGHTLPPTHPLSFKRSAHELFLDCLQADCGLLAERVIFPDEINIDTLPALISSAGGIDVCYGGIGIHGHVAFNEPEPGVSQFKARRVLLNDFTVTINAIRSRVGGNLENFPRLAYTLGMAEILAASRIRLYCRNGSEFDWANTVLRLALFGTPGDDYPVTHIRGHDYLIVTDRETLASPQYVL